MLDRVRWSAPQLIGALAVASLVAAVVAGLFSPAATFHLMPFRGFEFAIGALLFRVTPVRGYLAEIALLAGLALIVGALLLLDG